MPETEWPWKGEWNGDKGVLYRKNDTIVCDATSYICISEHWSGADYEPGVGDRWAYVWEEVIKHPIIIENPEPKAKLFIGVAGTTPTEVNIGDLAELIAKGDCEIHFEVRQPCLTIPIADYEFLGYKETEDGIVAEFLVLRKV